LLLDCTVAVRRLVVVAVVRRLCQIAARQQSATVVYETLHLNLSTAADSDNSSVAGLPVCDYSPPLSAASSPRHGTSVH